MSDAFSEYRHVVAAPCPSEDPSDCLAGAWALGICGEDWVWGWCDPDRVRIAFRRESDCVAFLARAGSAYSVPPLGLYDTPRMSL
ncbi:hypothetical protein [Bradyrhizobium sp. P5_C11_2]